MGYVHDTHMSQFIPPGSILKTAGTWTAGVSSNVVSEVRSVADAGFTLLVPALLPGNASAFKGARLKAVQVFYKIATAAADDFASVELGKVNLPADGSAPTGAAVSITLDAGHDTAAERKAVGDHTLTASLVTPAWLAEGDACWLALVVDAAATTAFTLYGARAEYELRV